MQSNDVVIRVENLWKRYGTTLTAEAKRIFRFRRDRQDAPEESHGPWALRNINFELRRGEILGVIGRNGSGKSTLLKQLAGVTPPTHGNIEIRGRIFPMIELNAGMHTDLTGRQNVQLLGAVMGFHPDEMRERMPEIESFCDLGEWFDQPLWMYSSGMLARLGFAVAVNVDADIILVDEVLSVGDFMFQKKCIERVNTLVGSGTTLILVSHNPYQVERMCDHVILLQAGAMEKLGDPADIVHRYFELSESNVRSSGSEESTSLRQGSGDLRVQKVEILDGAREAISEVVTGEPVAIRLYYRTTEPIWEPNFSIRVIDPQGTIVLDFDSTAAKKETKLCGEGYVECRIRNFPLMPNVYTLQVKTGGEVLLDIYDNAAKFTVIASSKVRLNSGDKGIAYAEGNWHYASGPQGG